MKLRAGTLQRHMLWELLTTFLISLVAFHFVLMMEKVLHMTKLLSVVGVSVFDMMRIILLVQPQLLIMTTPLAYFTAVLVTYGRMGMDNEITAMRAAGASFHAIARPALVFGVASFIASLLFSFYITPAGTGVLRETVSDIISRRASFAVQAGMFNTGFKDFVIHAKEKPASDVLKGVFIYDERDKARPTAVFAKKARILASDGYSLRFSLTDGFMHIVKGDVSTEMKFKRYDLLLPLSIEGPARRRTELYPHELLKEVRETPPGRHRSKVIHEFYRRLSLPVLCLILAFLGPPLSTMTGSSSGGGGGRLGGLVIGLIVFASYYAALVYGENLSIAGRIPHVVGAWSPALVLLAISLWLYRRAAQK